ncbi:MAG: alpha/beta fold hydrolase [Cyanobacteria bacterium P01_F01_bin.150]
MQSQPPTNPIYHSNSSIPSSTPWLIYIQPNSGYAQGYSQGYAQPNLGYAQANANPSVSAKMRLFCFPFAGGGASAFRSWAAELAPMIELVCVQLPGRENRMGEAPITHLPHIIEQLKPAILPHLSVPYAFFGHSMGALIAFELVRSLRQTQHPLPLHLFISACGAPQLPRHDPPRHTLAEPALRAELHRLKGTPTQVLNNNELMELLLPTIRADFSVVDTYAYQEQPSLTVPITVFGGEDDPEVSLEELTAWKTQATSDVAAHLFSGDHFFIQKVRSIILQVILATLLAAKDA